MDDGTKCLFTDDERLAVTALAAMVIPASEEYGVPGADDPAIVDNILVDASRYPEQLKDALAALDALAQKEAGLPYTSVSDVKRKAITSAFRKSHVGHAKMFANLTVQGYYRDDRVMRSIGLEARPPHPQGYEVEQGDWSLVNPGKKKAPFYRPTD